jgi:NADPH:quinone reductase-like Zn-dependent oxidoreductase
MMRAVVQDGYGPPAGVLRVRDVERPVAGDGEVLVRVRAASMHVDVWHVVTGRPYILRLMGSGPRRPSPRVPGTDLAGHVESVGPGVTRFEPGDRVFGESAATQWRNGGTYAEYAVVRQELLARKPGNVTFEQAAAVPASGTIALHGLRAAGGVRGGQEVLVNGAGGAVGGIAVQIARAQGARVTGVERASRLDLVRSLGADRVIDCAREDFTRADQRYDLVLDVASTLSLRDCRRVLSPGGVYVLIGHDHYGAAAGRVLGSLPRLLVLVARARFDEHLPRPSFRMPDRQETLATLRTLLESGRLTPVIGRTFPLEEVPAAMSCMQAGQVPGRIIITP